MTEQIHMLPLKMVICVPEPELDPTLAYKSKFPSISQDRCVFLR